MMEKIPLTKSQSEIMSKFYSIEKTKVIFDKKERDKLWNSTKKKDSVLNWSKLESCPALIDQIQNSYISGKNIQSAVFSECVYAQTLANMFKLNQFYNYSKNPDVIPDNIIRLLDSYYLNPRYIYTNTTKSLVLIQAGSCEGTDSALITAIDLNIFTIEFKEPYSKSSEHDLPPYKEDGQLVITSKFEKEYPQFHNMLTEQANLNFFDVMGRNINDFTQESIEIAVKNNFVNKKYAAVICTEDSEGYLTMLPANQAGQWGELTGEIRPAGRNHHPVWTPLALKKALEKIGAQFKGDEININKNNLEVAKERGGKGDKVSRYKINPIFFVYAKDCEENNEIIKFNISKIQQLRPTIATKIDFKKLDYNKVRDYYKPDLYLVNQL